MASALATDLLLRPGLESGLLHPEAGPKLKKSNDTVTFQGLSSLASLPSLAEV